VPTNFPGSVDVLTNPSSGSLLTSPSHASQHADVNDAVEAIETYILAFQRSYVEFTAAVNITATTEATANTVVTSAAVAYNGTDIVMVEFFAPYVHPAVAAGATISFYLYDGASSIGALGVLSTEAAAQISFGPMHLMRRITPSAATHTYSIRSKVSTGTGVVSAGAGGNGNDMPGFIRITRAN
jgi:hypothetical protein